MIPLLILISLIAGLWFPNIAAIVTLEVPSHIKLIESHEAPQQLKEAQRLWEEALAAKGGRERLHAARNMVFSTHGEDGRRLGKNQVRGESLFVFPNNSKVTGGCGLDC